MKQFKLKWGRAWGRVEANWTGFGKGEEEPRVVQEFIALHCYSFQLSLISTSRQSSQPTSFSTLLDTFHAQEKTGRRKCYTSDVFSAFSMTREKLLLSCRRFRVPSRRFSHCFSWCSCILWNSHPNSDSQQEWEDQHLLLNIKPSSSGRIFLPHRRCMAMIMFGTVLVNIQYQEHSRGLSRSE